MLVSSEETNATSQFHSAKPDLDRSRARGREGPPGRSVDDGERPIDRSLSRPLAPSIYGCSTAEAETEFEVEAADRIHRTEELSRDYASRFDGGGGGGSRAAT